MLFWLAYLLFWLAYLVSSALGWCNCYKRWSIQNLGWCIWYFHKTNVRISVYILWINFAKSSPFCFFWGKKYAGLKKVAFVTIELWGSLRYVLKVKIIIRRGTFTASSEFVPRWDHGIPSRAPSCCSDHPQSSQVPQPTWDIHVSRGTRLPSKQLRFIQASCDRISLGLDLHNDQWSSRLSVLYHLQNQDQQRV